MCEFFFCYIYFVQKYHNAFILVIYEKHQENEERHENSNIIFPLKTKFKKNKTKKKTH